MTLKVNGGIITQQVLAGNLRYFKMTGPFGWAVSDGTINLPLPTSGGNPGTTTYFVVGDTLPVPNSAAEHALAEISKKCTTVIIGLVGSDAAVTEIDFAVENNSMGWGSDTPDYSTPPANQPEDPAAAAIEMQAAVNALGVITVYSSIGPSYDNTAVPVTTTVDLGTVTITETKFNLV